MFLGRWICGFVCPFGWFQELLFKIKTKKYGVPNWIKKIKYVLLAVFVILLPILHTNIAGLGEPAYCKYVCPVGIFEGALPLIYKNPFLRNVIGILFFWKLSVLVVVFLVSVFYYRPFCKVLCPLGAIYGLFNKLSFYRYHVDPNKCIKCKRCVKVCKMDVSMYKTPNHTECIRCGDCKGVCPTGAITSGFKVENDLGDLGVGYMFANGDRQN